MRFKRLLALAAVPALAVVAFAAPARPSTATMPAPPGYTHQIFDDQFAGTSLDTSKWVTYVGDRGIRWDNRGQLPAPYSGFNQPGATGAAMYAPGRLTVNNGLTITAKRNTNQYANLYPWISGTINTEGKFTLPTDSAWYVQANIQMPGTSHGMWPAMWFLCAVQCSPENELDGWEGGFRELSGVPANRTAHYDYFSNAGQRASEQDLGLSVNNAYHTYGVEFKPNTYIKYYFDSQLKFTVNAGNGVNIPAEPYEIMLNEQVAASNTSGYHTVPTSTSTGGSMHVAEVQVWTP